MLRNNRNEPLQTAQNRTVNHHGATRRLLRLIVIIRRAVLEVKPLGKLEVELDGSALEGPAEGVANGDVDFGTVEGAVAWVELPFPGVEFVEGLRELL
jgi:hypothetical protein